MLQTLEGTVLQTLEGTVLKTLEGTVLRSLEGTVPSEKNVRTVASGEAT